MLRIFGLGVLVSLKLTATAAAHSGDSTQDFDEIIIWGRGIEQIGQATTASEGLVGYADLSKRPILRGGELLEVVPGMIATQHSGSGKANQYFLRGFNLDHGTDFAADADGVPVNLPTHGHGQGYLDLNFIIPELVEYVAFRKGPYHMTSGDFSAAGSASFITYDSLTRGFATAEIGENGYYRGVLANSHRLGQGDLLYAAEAQFYNGPWVLDEDLEKFNLLVKYTGDIAGADAQFIATAYRSTWTATDQIPQRAVDDGLIPRRGFIDPDLGGETTRFSLSAQFLWPHIEVRAYAVHYDLSLYSNFTYFLNDPVNGDEFEQADRRWVLGGAVGYEDKVTLFSRPATISTGLTLRYDDIGAVGLYNTAARTRLSAVRDDRVKQLQAGFYGSVEMHWTERFRTRTGFRVDVLDYRVAAQLTDNSGSGTDAIVSPKASLAWEAFDGIEFYASYGQSFHSNDVRGATISIDPVSGEPVPAVDALVKAEGAEVGVRFELKESLSVAVAGFWLDLDSELVFVGDAGTTEPNDATRRYGVEASAFWQAASWLVFDASAAYTHARFKDLPGEDRIPNAIGFVLGAGATASFQNGFTASLRLRHFGDAPLIEDNSVRSSATTLVNLGFTYDFGRVQAGLDLLNLFNVKDNDITYFFASRLAGEATGTDDIHFHPVEPFTVRARLSLRL